MAAGRRSRETATQRRERRAAIEDPEVVMEAAAAFLAARPRSIAEVGRRLRQHGYRAELVEVTLNRLIEMGYLDDAAFARAWVASRDRARPRGERALRQELIQKGIDRETIDAAMEERAAGTGTTPERQSSERQTSERQTSEREPSEATSVDELAAIRLLERHRRSLLREPDPARRRHKAYALLARNGFDPDTCRSVAAAFASVASDDRELSD